MALSSVIANSYSLGAFRVCSHGQAIAYRANLEATGPQAVAAVLAAGGGIGHLCGSVGPSHSGHYAVLEFLDSEGDIRGNRCIPTAEAFGWWVEAVELRAAWSDCRTCEPWSPELGN